MAMTVTMPQLGESVTEGTIARWLKQPGEAVAKYESIAEVVTDKVNAEIPAPAEGTMGEHIAEEGAVVAVGQPICSIETADQAPAGAESEQGQAAAPAEQAAPAQAPGPEPPAGAEEAAATAAAAQPVEAAAAQSAAQQPAPSSTAATQPAPAGPASGGNGSARGDYHLTPAVRMLVREHDVDLSQVQGTGLGGRISKKDVLDHVQRRDAGAGAQRQAGQSAAGTPASLGAAAGATPGTAGRAPAPGAAAAPAHAPTPQMAGGDELEPLTPTRRAIAEHMVRSKHTSPHAWLSMEVDMSRVSALRATRKAEFEQRYGVRLTYLPFVARAVCEALRQHPMLNSSFTDQGIITRHDVHLGIAVALEDNLIVPVVRNADRLSVAGLAATMQDLGDRARANKLKLDEIQGGTFTLNNTGALGTVHTMPIINQPQAGILAMDAVIKRPVVVNDAIAIRPMMNLGLSFDHRIVDGLGATRFTKLVKDILESIDENAALL